MFIDLFRLACNQKLQLFRYSIFDGQGKNKKTAGTVHIKQSYAYGHQQQSLVSKDVSLMSPIECDSHEAWFTLISN